MPAYPTREDLEKAMQDAQTWLEGEPDRTTLEAAVDLFIGLTDRYYRERGECRLHAFYRALNAAQNERNRKLALLAVRKVEEEEAKLRKH